MFNVFVACPYSPPPLVGYREVFTAVEGELPYAKFHFADETINSDVILSKIVGYIRSSSLCLCDITDWNPNVTMELGLALGMEKRVQLLFRERRGLFRRQLSVFDLPADIRGHGRINYSNTESLQTGLRALIRQELAKPDSSLAAGSSMLIREAIFSLIVSEPGLKSWEIARRLGLDTREAKASLDGLVRDDRIYKEGTHSAVLYYAKGYVRSQSKTGSGESISESPQPPRTQPTT